MVNKFIELVLSGAQHAEKAVGSFALTTKLLKVKTEIDYCRKRILLDPGFHDLFLKKLDLKEIIDAESVLSMVEDLGLENLEFRNEIPSSIQGELRCLTQSKLDAQIIELEMQLAAGEKRVSEDDLADKVDDFADTLKEGFGKAASYFDKKK